MNPANEQWLEENRERLLSDLNKGAIRNLPRGKVGMILQNEFGHMVSIDEDHFESASKAIRLLFGYYDKWLAVEEIKTEPLPLKPRGEKIK